MQHDLDKLFTYHPPTDAAKLRHAAIGQAEREAVANLEHVERWVAGGCDTSSGDDKLAMMNHVNTGCKLFAEAVIDCAPDSHDRTAAILAIRLARNAANEGIMSDNLGRLFAIARTKLQEARWLANGAVALEYSAPR